MHSRCGCAGSWGRVQLAIEPGARFYPLAPDCAVGDTEQLSDLALLEAAEVSPLDDLTLPRFELVQRRIQCEQLFRIYTERICRTGKCGARPAATALGGLTPPRFIYQHLAHCARGNADQMGAIFCVRTARKLQI